MSNEIEENLSILAQNNIDHYLSIIISKSNINHASHLILFFSMFRIYYAKVLCLISLLKKTQGLLYLMTNCTRRPHMPDIPYPFWRLQIFQAIVGVLVTKSSLLSLESGFHPVVIGCGSGKGLFLPQAPPSFPVATGTFSSSDRHLLLLVLIRCSLIRLASLLASNCLTVYCNPYVMEELFCYHQVVLQLWKCWHVIPHLPQG